MEGWASTATPIFTRVRDSTSNPETKNRPAWMFPGRAEHVTYSVRSIVTRYPSPVSVDTRPPSGPVSVGLELCA